MDIFSVLQNNLSFIWEILFPFLVALTILVFVHELGHYMVARWCGVRIEVFSVGFGSELKGWTDKHGTRWKIAAIPLGGYVKMFGEGENISEGEGDKVAERPMTPSERDVSFHHKTLCQRAAIVFAGPLINFIFAILAFGVLFTTIGVPSPVSERPLAIIGTVSAGSAAANAGLERGDRIVQINGNQIDFFGDLQKIVKANPAKPLLFKIEREKTVLEKTITPGSREQMEDGNKVTIGLLGVMADPGELTYERQNPFASLWMGVERTYYLTNRILGFIGDIFVGQQSPDELGGVLRIAQISGQVAESGIADYISFLAVLSINLGLINLFPIPLLDGGHLAFYLVEAIRGRPIGERVQEYVFRFGFVVIISLFIFVTWNDLVHLRFFEFITDIFG
ncbi:MAG: RIP metalloprotease RseP [Rhodospirillales bacterium]|nr:RIP metalloprotease RseP [Rhodospirillales bacterium]